MNHHDAIELADQHEALASFIRLGAWRGDWAMARKVLIARLRGKFPDLEIAKDWMLEPTGGFTKGKSPSLRTLTYMGVPYDQLLEQPGAILDFSCDLNLTVSITAGSVTITCNCFAVLPKGDRELLEVIGRITMRQEPYSTC